MPYMDLGIKYFSSSTDSDFINEQSSNPNIFRYKIIKIFTNRNDALELEIRLHNKFDVGQNPLFYNKAKQTSTGFDMTGIPRTKEFKKHISELFTNRFFSEKTKKLISDNVTELWKNDEYVQKQKASRKPSDGIRNNNSKPVTIYDNNHQPILSVLFNIKESLDILGMPGTSFQQSLYKNKPLFQSTRKTDIAKIKNKGIYQYKGWYAKHAKHQLNY